MSISNPPTTSNLPPPSRRCQAVTQSGKQCKAYAIHNESFCSVHAGRNTAGGAPEGNSNATKHGFYSGAFSNDELAQLVAYADDLTLDDEIGAARVTNARLLLYTMQNADGLDADTLSRLVVAQMRGLKTVADLLRAKRAVSGEAGDGIAGAIAAALDELGNEWGIEL